MFSKITHFFNVSYEEMKKVVWPSRKEVISHTIIVIVSTAIAMAFIAAIDLGLGNLVIKLLEQAR